MIYGDNDSGRCILDGYCEMSMGFKSRHVRFDEGILSAHVDCFYFVDAF